MGVPLFESRKSHSRLLAGCQPTRVTCRKANPAQDSAIVDQCRRATWSPAFRERVIEIVVPSGAVEPTVVSLRASLLVSKAETPEDIVVLLMPKVRYWRRVATVAVCSPPASW